MERWESVRLEGLDAGPVAEGTDATGQVPVAVVQEGVDAAAVQTVFSGVGEGDGCGATAGKVAGAAGGDARRRAVLLYGACGTLALGLTAWAVVMTVLYAQAVAVATTPRAADPLGVAALSHFNVVVDDVDAAADYYGDLLGFERAHNSEGPMDYRNITLPSFCLDAGFADGACRVDILFLRHPVVHLYLEVFKYYEPAPPNAEVAFLPTNTLGGVRHVALEVLNATDTYFALQAKDHAGRFVTDLPGGPLRLTPFPYYFFYFLDRYGVQWEFEQGRPVQYYEVAGITG